MENFNENNIKYLEAQNRVKKLKGFYIHAIVYVLVNLFILAQNVESGESLAHLNNYWNAICWDMESAFSCLIWSWEKIGKRKKFGS
mgnify:CR=1 FL=1